MFSLCVLIKPHSNNSLNLFLLSFLKNFVPKKLKNQNKVVKKNKF